MPLLCTFRKDYTGLRSAIAHTGSDFWLGSQEGVDEDGLADKLETMQIEGFSAADDFTHCYIARSDDIKTATNTLILEFGLGLRRRRCRSRHAEGCVFVLVHQPGPSPMWISKFSSGSDIRRISPKERSLRAGMSFIVATEQQLLRVAQAEQGNFWLTSFGGLDAEAAKTRAVTVRVDDEAIDDRFSYCLLVEVSDCHMATSRVISVAGLGLRTMKVRSKPVPGCMVLLIPPLGPSSQMCENLLSRQTEAIMAQSHHSQAIFPSQETQSAVARFNESAAVAPVNDSTPGHGMIVKRPANAPPAEARAQKYPKVLTDSQESHVEALRQRLAALLFELCSELTADVVQERLEDLMGQPRGRLSEFRGECEDIWRSLMRADANKGGTAELDPERA